MLLGMKADQGIGFQPVLDKVTLPLKTQMCSLGDALGFTSEPGCPGFDGGQECLCTVKASVPAVLIS